MSVVLNFQIVDITPLSKSHRPAGRAISGLSGGMAHLSPGEAISFHLPCPPPDYVRDAIKMLSDQRRPLLRWVNRQSFTRHVANILGGEDEDTKLRWTWCEARYASFLGSLRLEQEVAQGVSDEDRKLVNEWTEGESPRLATKGVWSDLRALARRLHALRRKYKTVVDDVKEAQPPGDLAEYWAWCAPRPWAENSLRREAPLGHPERPLSPPAPRTRPTHPRLSRPGISTAWTLRVALRGPSSASWASWCVNSRRPASSKRKTSPSTT